MAANINMRSVQEGVEDGVKQAGELGRKAFLATLGVAGMGYDLSKSIVKDSGEWLDKAEKRGIKVEKEVRKYIAAYQKDFPGEVKKLAHNIEEGVTTVAKDVNAQTEKLSAYVQKMAKSNAESVSEAVVDIQVKAEKVVNKAADKAQDVVESVQKNGADAVKSAKIETPASLQDAVDSVTKVANTALDKVWKGYDDLSVKDILSGLEGKSMKTLEEVRKHELASKNRVTVIREIDAKIQAMTS